MMKHQPHLPRPLTEIERIIREIEPRSPEELPLPERLQVPGFRDPNDPRIPAALRRLAIEPASSLPQRRRNIGARAGQQPRKGRAK